ncbi:hypothetical protein SeMB42_g06387 [Synchytrium endobioticum]|uniref:Laccase n=1 Tax=Synchytrium endobioticum TaxID=286115 RepID=A0A507CLS5_9FUNG|nr:hypothetical protein SeMB42_g06387 [Synchytrium endobioticum]
MALLQWTSKTDDKDDAAEQHWQLSPPSATPHSPTHPTHSTHSCAIAQRINKLLHSQNHQRRKCYFIIAVPLLLVVLVAAIGAWSYTFVVSTITAAQDGVPRKMLVVNGQYPGPLIEANMGDRILVNLINKLDNGTSIHWHGIHHRNSVYMDGTVGITQCPVPPGANFTYDFTITGQFGTFWWHAHVSTQYNDGIVGPFIVHSPTDPLLNHYDKDLVIMLTDWYHEFSQSLVSAYLTTGLVANPAAEPVPDNGLINGLNVFNCSLGPSLTSSNCSGGARSTFTLHPNTKYRLRLINTGAFAAFTFSVDNHELLVVEADATPVNPVMVHRVPIHVAQRYSVILTTNQPTGAYWMRAVMTQDCFKYIPTWLNPSVTAILRYSNTDSAAIPASNSKDWSDTPSQPSQCIDLSLGMLIPALAETPALPTARYDIDVSFLNAGGLEIRNTGFMNGKTWTPLMNTTSLLMSFGNLTSLSTMQYVETIPSVTVADLVVNNLDSGAHPFHLHGHTMFVLAEGSGIFTEKGTPALNFSTNPLRRDTIVLPSNGYAIVRIVFDNPGVWAFHCHISWHMSAGLLMQFNVLPDQIMKMSIPDSVRNLCAGSKSGGPLIG